MQVGLVILDGWGLNPDSTVRDAVAAADTPNFDRYRAAGAHSTLTTHGRAVGLPEGQMGNSEVGHLNIGAGRVVKQDSTRITDDIERARALSGNQNASSSDDIEDGTFFENEVLGSAFEHAEANDGRVHFLGLVSDGGVHSYQKHLHALIEMAADRGTPAVTHAFTDGRDTSPKGGEGYLRELQDHADEHGTGHVASVSGRYYAMDRDQNWDRTMRAYGAVVDHQAEYSAPSGVEAVTDSYARGDTDEFIEPTVIENQPAMDHGDAAIFFNFRSDRARQLTRMLGDIRSEDWDVPTTPPDVRLVTMTQYDATFDLPVAYPPHQPEDTLGEVLSETGHTQLRLAETEKYAHVTYFLNGGREVEFAGERREIVESPDVPTYDLRPEMSAPGVTDTAVEVIRSDDPDALVLNYANPDMVGHTGEFDAAVEAVEAVDEQLGRLVEAITTAGGHVLITADHGNADDMGTVDEPHTAHTLNPVPFIFLAPEARSGTDLENASGEAASGESDGGKTAREGGTLADLAPTMLALMDVEQPGAMTGTSLLE